MNKCKCIHSRDYEFNTHGADFYCHDCNMTYSMCCAVYVNYLCGKVDGHDGAHTSISGREWTNEVYENSKR